jgi:IMP dehydrogenase
MRFLEEPHGHDLTYSDVFLVPSRSDVTSRFGTDLTPNDGTPARIPLVSANMNAVTGPRLAASLARRGGLGVLPQDLPPAELVQAIGWVKDQPVGFDTAIRLPVDATVADALGVVPAGAGHGVVVQSRDDGPDGEPRVLGAIPAQRLADTAESLMLSEFLEETVPALNVEQTTDPREAFETLAAAELDFAPVRDGDRIVGAISRTAALRSSIYPPAVDAEGRLAVAAAIGINGDVAAKAQALKEAGADVLVVDTAHGHQEGTIRAVAAVASLDLGLPIVAGNIVTPEGVNDLVDAGATILKVGVGPGAMCTTRMMTAVGRPQFSAVLDTAEAARAAGAHVWADGGVRYPRDVALALAAGAASVMIGSWFTGTVEAPGRVLFDDAGRAYKENWGMASARAVNERFSHLSAYEFARKQLFAEGISSSTIYLDPLRPSVEDLVDMITSGLRSSMTYAGASDLAAFHDRAVVGLQSAAGYEEGKALPVSW